MTSRELTSGFDFWSFGYIHIAVIHVPTTFGTNSSIQFGVLTFSEIQDVGCRHVGFSSYLNLAHSGLLIV